MGKVGKRAVRISLGPASATASGGLWTNYGANWWQVAGVLSRRLGRWASGNTLKCRAVHLHRAFDGTPGTIDRGGVGVPPLGGAKEWRGRPATGAVSTS